MAREEVGSPSTEAGLAPTVPWQDFDEGYARLAQQVHRLEQEPLSLFERRELLAQAQGQNRQCVSILEMATKVLREQVFEASARVVRSADAGPNNIMDPFEPTSGLPNELHGYATPLTSEETTCLQNYEKNLQELEASVRTLEDMTQRASEPHPLSVIMRTVTHVARLSYETSRAEKLIMV